MAQYTVEDIEILRQKSGISYEEAVNLLEYHNGSLARALVDLEKNGRLHDAKRGHVAGGHKSKAGGFFNYLFRMRLKVQRDNLVIANLSMLFVIFTAICAGWVLLIGLAVAMVLGYRISVERNSRDFSADSLETVVKNASSNVKNTAFTMARDLGIMDKGRNQAAPPQEQPRAEAAPTGTTPVNVQFPDGGTVNVQENQDGSHEANIQ